MSQQQIVSVSNVAARIKHVLNQHLNLNEVWIQGEISNLTKHRSGHYYFSMKDSEAALNCVMFSSNVKNLNFDLEEGMKVLAQASVNIYPPRGSLQLYISRLKPDGIGALYLEFEQRKQRLMKLGYFDSDKKIPKPEDIQRIAIITAKEGAALQDVVSTIRKRWPSLQMTVYPALVQGVQAPPVLISQFKKADEQGYDAILIVRGGGSFEDLFCFNDEQLIETLYHRKTYTVSGVGHEVDTTLCDLVCDHRAVTPTAAAQWISLDWMEQKKQLIINKQRLAASMEKRLEIQKQALQTIQANPYISDPMSWILDKRLRLDASQMQMHKNIERFLMYKKDVYNYHQRIKQIVQNFEEQNRERLEERKKNFLKAENQYREDQRRRLYKYVELLEAYSPLKTIQRGYAIASKDNKPVRSINQVQINDTITIRLSDGSLETVVSKKEKSNDEKENDISTGDAKTG